MYSMFMQIWKLVFSKASRSYRKQATKDTMTQLNFEIHHKEHSKKDYFKNHCGKSNLIIFLI